MNFALSASKAQIVRTGWYRSVHVKSFESHRARALLGARTQLIGALLVDRSDVALIVRPMLVAWRQLREQIAVFDKAIRLLVKSNSACRLRRLSDSSLERENEPTSPQSGRQPAG
jgi:transposase